MGEIIKRDSIQAEEVKNYLELNGSPDSTKVVAEVFSSLPESIKKECQEYFSQLPNDVVARIIEVLGKNKPEKESRIEREFDMMNREDRVSGRTFNREDIKEFKEDELPSLVEENMVYLFSRYLEPGVMSSNSYEEFKSVVGDFIGKIWSCRGKNELDTPEQTYLNDVEQRRNHFNKTLGELTERRKNIEAKIGKRKRVPNNLEKERSEVLNAIAELKDKNASMDFENYDVRGRKAEAIEYRDLYKAGVYFCEHFSSEEYAVLLLEFFDGMINRRSKLRGYSKLNPELLDYPAKFFEEWAGEHEGESALIGGKDKNKKMEFLIQHFITSISSYLRHKNNENISERERECLAKELPIMLKMLKKF